VKVNHIHTVVEMRMIVMIMMRAQVCILINQWRIMIVMHRKMMQNIPNVKNHRSKLILWIIETLMLILMMMTQINR